MLYPEIMQVLLGVHITHIACWNFVLLAVIETLANLNQTFQKTFQFAADRCKIILVVAFVGQHCNAYVVGIVLDKTLIRISMALG